MKARPSRGSSSRPPPPVLKSETVEITVDAGMLDAWIIGLKKKLFVNNEAAAREFGVLDVINRIGIAELEEKLKARERGLLLFEVTTNG